MRLDVLSLTLNEEEDSKREFVEPFGDLSGYKALSWVRNKPTWVEPTIYPTLHAHPNLASSLLLLKSPDWGTTIAIYPVSTLAVNNNLIIRHGQVLANARRVSSGAQDVWVVCARTDEPGEDGSIVRRVVDEARKLVGSSKLPQAAMNDGSGFWDGIGVCTWEGLGAGATRPTKDILLSLVPSYPISTFLIDDGWQDINNGGHQARRLRTFNPWVGFGGSLSEVVQALKERGVGEVGVWMTLQGYWDGIDPDSELRGRYDCQEHRIGLREQPRGDVEKMRPGENSVWLPSVEKAETFWKDWFAELKGAGIGFVKIDNQACYDVLIGRQAEEAQAAMWSGMLNAVVDTWGSLDRVIMCMSHNERMLNGPGGLDFARPSGRLVFRNSDDFNMRYPDRHTDFIRWNVYSSILTGHLSFDLDFDMFSTTPADRLPLYHALLRALGPGPFLVSDTPGENTDIPILDRLTAQDSQGRLVGVKMPRPAAVPSNRWFWDNVEGNGDGPALVAVVPAPDAQGGLTAAWNARKAEGGERAVDLIGRDEVRAALGEHGQEVGAGCVIWRTGLCGPAGFELCDAEWGGVRLEMGKDECELFVVARVWTIGGCKVAILGMLDKLAPLAGVHVESRNDALVISCNYISIISVLVVQKPHVDHTLSVRDEKGKDLSVRKEDTPGGMLYQMSVGENSANRPIHITAP